jgi:hypothetical protein
MVSALYIIIAEYVANPKFNILFIHMQYFNYLWNSPNENTEKLDMCDIIIAMSSEPAIVSVAGYGWCSTIYPHGLTSLLRY